MPHAIIVATQDTSPEAQAVLTQIYRDMPLAQKAQIVADMYRMGRNLHEAGVLQRNPQATEAEILDDWFRQTLEPELYASLQAWRKEHGR